MSTSNPILILQMQRMGDLVLSFPLLGWLGAAFPGHPLWVVGEPAFFEPLMPLSPRVTYFSYKGGVPDFSHTRFHTVINLSHRPEAAMLAAAAKSDELVGPYMVDSGELHIQGNWQLYRSSLTHNNRYNLYHWADLNALDLIPAGQMQRTNWPLPRPFRTQNTPRAAGRIPAAGTEIQSAAATAEAPAAPLTLEQEAETQAVAGQAAPVVNSARVGLFLGASEPDKHPDVEFWANLARLLIKQGHKPVLLGGEAEKPLGHAVAARIKAFPLNLCGHFSVRTLAEFIADLDLLVTPDTGPMHVAVWSGTPVLNLSLGPVNPWETGPFSSGHHVVRPVLDCIGCWGCVRPLVDCKERLVAGRVAGIIDALLGNRGLDGMERLAPGLELLRTGRGAGGLFTMAPVFSSAPKEGFLTSALRHGAAAPDGTLDIDAQAFLAASRHDMALFWKAWFGELFGRGTSENTKQAWTVFHERHPRAAKVFALGIADLALALAKTAKTDAAYLLENPDFWREVPPLLQPLSGYIHMYVQNSRARRESLLHALSLAERLQALM